MSRPIHDKLIWSHIFPSYVVWRCYKKDKKELGSLTFIMTILSLMYHRKKESDKIINFIENHFGKAFSIYATLHALNCKHKKMQKVEILLLIVGYLIYYFPGYGFVDYEKWHVLNHIWPLTWLLIFVEKHDNIIIK